MTNRQRIQALQKIRKLPKLKKGYKYMVHEGGMVHVAVNGECIAIIFYDYSSFVEERYCGRDINEHLEYFENPVYKNGKLVGYK